MNRRRHEDDDDDYPSSKRQKREQDPKKLESLILRLGEKSASSGSLESNLETLAGVLEADLPNYKGTVLTILCDCAINLPDKLTIYTTLVGLLNARSYNFGGEVVEMIIQEFKDALKSCQFENARMLLRFLSDFVNCRVVSAGSLLTLYETMTDVTLEEGVPQVRQDWYVYAVMCALPWVGRELYEKKEQDLDQLLGKIDGYVAKRTKTHQAALRVWSVDTPHPQEEYIDSLWAQIRKLRSDRWQERHILRPYVAFDTQLCEALQHNLPAFTPPPHFDGANYPYPTVVFRMFDYTDCPEGPALPGAHSIERFLIDEQIHRIIESNHKERKQCASQLLSYPVKSKIPLEYVIVEAIFAELFTNPTPRYLEVFYGSLIIELCRLQPSSMPQVLAQTSELLFERIENMNVSCFDRYVTWFAYHLSNFQFRWNWDDWVYCTEQHIDRPKPKFIQEALVKCMRLSYHQRIMEIMPSQFEALLPPRPESLFKYGSEKADSVEALVAAKLAVAFENKYSPENVTAIIKDLPNPLQEEEVEPSHNPLKIEVFVQTLFNQSNKSFSHSFAAIARYHAVFKSLSETEESQICILRSLYDLWKNNQHMLVVLVDKLLKLQIVECFAVANWVFSKDMSSEFTRMYVWEILHITIVKMIRRVKKLQQQVEDTKRKMREDRSSPEKETSMEEELEGMEEKLETAQSEQKNLFLIIFQRFIMLLTEHIVRSEGESQDYKNDWYRWTISRLQQVFMAHHEVVFKYTSTLETLLFTADIDSHILDVFQQFAALRG